MKVVKIWGNFLNRNFQNNVERFRWSWTETWFKIIILTNTNWLQLSIYEKERFIEMLQIICAIISFHCVPDGSIRFKGFSSPAHRTLLPVSSGKPGSARDTGQKKCHHPHSHALRSRSPYAFPKRRLCDIWRRGTFGHCSRTQIFHAGRVTGRDICGQSWWAASENNVEACGACCAGIICS